VSSSDIDPEVSLNLHAALASVLNEDDSLLNRWIVMAEHVVEGGRSVSYITSPGLSTWEVLGMVKATEIVAQEHMLSDYEDDDE
jgi:hypothetical protein